MSQEREEFAQLARVMKGFANHNRIKILLALSRQGGVTIDHLSEELGVSYFTLFDHLQKLLDAQMVERKQDDSFWVYRLSSLGKSGVTFIKRVQSSLDL